MPPTTQNLHDTAVEHICQCFSLIKQQVEQAGKEIAAYYFYLVDDFFAAGNAAITHQDLAAFAAKYKKEYKNAPSCRRFGMADAHFMKAKPKSRMLQITG